MIFSSQGIASQPDDEVLTQDRYPFAVVESTDIDMGRVVQGAAMQGKVLLRNEGSHELQLAQVRSSCGLLIQSWPSAPIPAGQEMSISFRYDTRRIGSFERFITIHSNTYQRNLVVRVRGEVVPPAPDIPEPNMHK